MYQDAALLLVSYNTKKGNENGLWLSDLLLHPVKEGRGV
jgi:hypothetical protein